MVCVMLCVLSWVDAGHTLASPSFRYPSCARWRPPPPRGTCYCRASCLPVLMCPRHGTHMHPAQIHPLPHAQSFFSCSLPVWAAWASTSRARIASSSSTRTGTFQQMSRCGSCWGAEVLWGGTGLVMACISRWVPREPRRLAPRQAGRARVRSWRPAHGLASHRPDHLTFLHALLCLIPPPRTLIPSPGAGEGVAHRPDAGRDGVPLRDQRYD